MAGKPQFNNGIVEIQRNPDKDIIPEGFVRGRLPLSQSHKEKLSKNNGIHRLTPEEMAARNAKISLTKQSKSKEEKELYSKTLSISMKGKGAGRHPWNYQKHGVQTAWNKGKTGYMTDEQKLNMVRKQFETKRRNNTFHVSKEEDKLYAYLVEQYGSEDVVRQYKDERYPFSCDFYIKSQDLFIELNAHWTHGGRPYKEEDSICQQQLHEWLLKAKSSDYYKQAIDTWTRLDVKKCTTALDNKLNYTVIY